MSQQFIKLVLSLPSFFTIHPSSDNEPNVFRISTLNRPVSCVVCSSQTVRHSKERRRFLDETKRHYHVRTIDRSLACRPEQLDDADLEVARACLREDKYNKDIYYGLQHMRFVLKSTTSGQASRRLKEWIDRFMSHPCGPLAKIAKAVIVRQRVMENTIFSPLSNGKIEGTNNKNKLIKRRAFGYRNLNNFFTRLKLELGSSK